MPEEGRAQEVKHGIETHRSPAQARDLRRYRKGAAVIGEAACKTDNPAAGIMQ